MVHARKRAAIVLIILMRQHVSTTLLGRLIRGATDIAIQMVVGVLTQMQAVVQGVGVNGVVGLVLRGAQK